MVTSSDATAVSSLGTFPNETVSLTSLSYLHSYLFIVGASAAATLSTKWIVPLIAEYMGFSISPAMVRWALGTLGVASALLALTLKKELTYEISLIYTIWGSKAWWTRITDKVILGALPLKSQKDKIKALGVTHVITTLEEFEGKKGLVHPLTSQEWKGASITHKHIVAEDFVGMPAKKIHEAVEYIHGEIQSHPNTQFYVHCKAGRGRSATVVVAYLWKYGSQNFTTKEAAYNFVKNLRPQINLNENQMAALQAYIDQYPKLARV
ncbi:MAG: dual specificity protein phosphatase family protein [Verrucomicrobia bacterium]|nr:dual specificity protein phosphatase family protein [Verrucomicrobiota bacterium]